MSTDCFNYNQNNVDPCVQTNSLFRAENCCDSSGDQITVQLLLNSTPILSLNPGFFYNGNCYRLLYMEQNQNNPSIIISQNSFVFSNICGEQLCPDCPTPTPTPTPSTTPDSWTIVTNLLTLEGCCDGITYTANTTLNVSANVNDYVYLINGNSPYSSSFTSGCYKILSSSAQTGSSQGTITENYGSVSCTSCTNNHPCLQKYTGCSEQCTVVSYPYDTVLYTITPDGATYEYTYSHSRTMPIWHL